MKKHIIQIIPPVNLDGGCNTCQSTCQTACKTSATVSNQSCQAGKDESAKNFRKNKK